MAPRICSQIYGEDDIVCDHIPLSLSNVNRRYTLFWILLLCRVWCRPTTRRRGRREQGSRSQIPDFEISRFTFRYSRTVNSASCFVGTICPYLLRFIIIDFQELQSTFVPLLSGVNIPHPSFFIEGSILLAGLTALRSRHWTMCVLWLDHYPGASIFVSPDGNN